MAHDTTKIQPNPADDNQPSHFDNTVGMTGPVPVTYQVNEKKDPSLQPTEANDDISQISVQKDPPDVRDIGTKPQTQEE